MGAKSITQFTGHRIKCKQKTRPIMQFGNQYSSSGFLNLTQIFLTLRAPLAQLVEHMTLNHQVAGSSPAGCTS